VKKSWVKFYPADYKGDESLSACSIAARGLWMEMLTVMFASEPPGYMVWRNGKPIPETKLRKTLRLLETPEEIVAALRELEENYVFSRTPEGVIFCRRIVREAERSRKMAAIARVGVEKRRTAAASQQSGEQPRQDRQTRRADRLEDEMRRLTEGKGNLK